MDSYIKTKGAMEKITSMGVLRTAIAMGCQLQKGAMKNSSGMGWQLAVCTLSGSVGIWFSGRVCSSARLQSTERIPFTTLSVSAPAVALTVGHMGRWKTYLEFQLFKPVDVLCRP